MATGVIAAEVVPLIIEAAPALIEAVSTIGPMVAEVASTVGPVVAEAAGTVAPLIAEVGGAVAEVAAPLAEAVTPLVEGAGMLGEVASGATEVLGHSALLDAGGGVIETGVLQQGGSMATEVAPQLSNAAPELTQVVAEQWAPFDFGKEFGSSMPQQSIASGPWKAWTPADSGLVGDVAQGSMIDLGPSGPTSVMSRFTGPQFSGNALPSAPSLSSVAQTATAPGGTFGPAAGFGGGPAAPFTGSGFGTTPLGATGGGTVPTTASAPDKGTTLQDLLKNKWFKSAMRGVEGLGKQGQQQGESKAQGPVHQGATAPPLNPYESGHRAAQSAYAQSVMEQYLAGGGYG